MKLKIFITLAADSIRLLTHTHTHAHITVVMREHESNMKRNGVGQCDVMEILVIACCVVFVSVPLGFENNGYTRNFPFPKQ